MSIEQTTIRSLRLAIGTILALSAGVAVAQQTTATGSEGLEEIVVTGSQLRLPEPLAGGQVANGGRAGILGNMGLLETPFSSTNYTEELIRNQQAKSVADVLLNDPNVRAGRGFGNFQEVFFIRGFPAFSDDMTYNGIYGILPRQFVAAEYMERVELFRGASAFLNGAAPGGSNLGGTINLVPKRAPDQPLTRLTVGYESNAAGYLAADIGRRFGADNATGIRANAAYRDGETSVEDQDRQLKVLAFGIDHNGDKLRLAADIGYQDHHIDSPRPSVSPPSFGAPATGIPKPPDADSNFAQPWTYTDEQQLFGVVRAEYEFTRAISAWAAVGGRDGKEKNVLANPTFNDANPDTTASRFDNAREDNVMSAEIGLRFDFDTGPIGHRVIASGSLFSFDSKNAFTFYFAPIASDLEHPIDQPKPDASGGVFPGGDLNHPLKTLTTDTSSLALADVLSFADGKFMLTLGGRDQKLEGETFDYNTGARTSKYDDSKVTPVGGLVFRPTDTVSLFANYIEGLIAGDVAPTQNNGNPVINGGEAQQPYTAKQMEAGVKYDSGKFGATLSIFDINKAFGMLEEADDPNTTPIEFVYRADGEQRHRGAEIGFFGEPLDGFRVIGGLTWLDAEVTKTDNAAIKGKTPIGAPENQANVNIEWDLPALQGLTLEGRALYTSSQFIDGANDLEIDSWTRFDIGARYATEIAGRPFTVRARIDNVTNENDWVSAGGYPGFGYMVLGAPRTYVVSASFDF